MPKGIRTGKLGDFQIISGKAVVSDPCYTRGTWCAGVIKNVKNGTWVGIIRKSDEGKWGTRVAELLAFHEDYLGLIERKTWDWQPIDVGVDSGQCGIFDETHYKDNKVVPRPWNTHLIPDDDWYDMCCKATQGDVKGGTIPYGVVSSSGYGDGSYRCYTVTKDGKIVAIKITYLLIKGRKLMKKLVRRQNGR